MPSTAVTLLTLLRGGGAGATPAQQLATDVEANGGLALWLADANVYNHATNEVAAVDGGPVRGWKSLIDGYKPAQAGDVALTPTWRESVVAANNRAALECDGGDLLDLTSGWNGLVDYANGPWTWIAVYATTSPEGSMAVVYNATNTTSARRVVLVVDADSNQRVQAIQRGGATTISVEVSEINPNDGNLHILSAERSSSTSFLARFDNTAGTPNATPVDPETITALRFGADQLTFYTGYLFAVVLMDNVANAAAVRQLLADYYGIAL